MRGFAPCLALFSYSRGCVEFGRLTTVLFGELSAFTESRSVTRSLLLDAYTRGYKPNSARNDWFPLRHPDVSPILQLPSIPGFSRPCSRFCSRGIDLPTSQSENEPTDSHDRRSVSLRLPAPLHITIPLCCTAAFPPPPYFSASFYFHRCFISLLRLSCAVFAAVIEFYLRAESESIKPRPPIMPYVFNPRMIKILLLSELLGTISRISDILSISQYPKACARKRRYQRIVEI